MARVLRIACAGVAALLLGAAPALACGGLIGPRGTVNLLRTTTLSAYHDGIEHYVTSFEFAGSGGKFGSIVPLPAIPDDIEKAGKWTLQRLLQEVRPPEFAVARDASTEAVATQAAIVVKEAKVDALDVTILKGGGDQVGVWAKDNGFVLPPDAPEVLDFYAARSPIFMAVKFNGKRAADRDLQQGDGIPIHLTIPTDNPWVPLRILGLGKDPREQVQADVFLLTDRRPNLLPAPTRLLAGGGMKLLRSEPASEFLLADLRSDRGMEWLPDDGMWLSYLEIDAPAGDVTHDLAIDATGLARPDAVDAGLTLAGPPTTPAPEGSIPVVFLVVAGLAVVVVVVKAADGFLLRS